LHFLFPFVFVGVGLCCCCCCCVVYSGTGIPESVEKYSFLKCFFCVIHIRWT